MFIHLLPYNVDRENFRSLTFRVVTFFLCTNFVPRLSRAGQSQNETSRNLAIRQLRVEDV